MNQRYNAADNESTDLLSRVPLSRTKPLRAIVEIVAGKLRIFPVSDSDVDEQHILDALRFAVEDFRQ